MFVITIKKRKGWRDEGKIVKLFGEIANVLPGKKSNLCIWR